MVSVAGCVVDYLLKLRNSTMSDNNRFVIIIIIIIVVSAVLRVVLGGNGNLMVQIDFFILNSRPRMRVQNQRT